ncbi:hypothetical protein RSK20926_06277 [Roseobacter sp. SK209-2-6]|nr:hypothetical protein RSK20926_06277 [Roseobacter sp. SK209-2-6]
MPVFQQFKAAKPVQMLAKLIPFPVGSHISLSLLFFSSSLVKTLRLVLASWACK